MSRLRQAKLSWPRNLTTLAVPPQASVSPNLDPPSSAFSLDAIADGVSPDPWGGRAQIRKFFVFLFIPLVYAVFVRQFSKVYYLMMAWTLVASASGIMGSYAISSKNFRHAHQTDREFYVAYLERRTTGFESHWMTFGALELSVLFAATGAISSLQSGDANSGRTRA